MTLLARLPVFRRYTAEISRLRKALEATRGQLTATRAEVERLRATKVDQDWIETAQRFAYLWRKAPKRFDVRDSEPFGTLAAAAVREGRTFLDIDRLYTLWQMVQRLPPAARAVAEVGVYKGGSARFIAEALRSCEREVPFYVCDTFEGHAEVDETLDGSHRIRQQFVHVKYEKVVKYLAPYPFVRLVRGNIRETAPALASEEAFGFVHVDVDVYPITKFCLEFFVPRLVVGGAIVVDDYGSRKCEGVARAVDEFTRTTPKVAALHLLSGQGVLIRTT